MDRLLEVYRNGTESVRMGGTFEEGAGMSPDVFSDIYKDRYGFRPRELHGAMHGQGEVRPLVERAMLELSRETLSEIRWPWANGRPVTGMVCADACPKVSDLPDNVLACLLRLEGRPV